MTEVKACGHTYLVKPRNTRAQPELIAACQRPEGHIGEHAAVWMTGFIEWETPAIVETFLYNGITLYNFAE